MPAAAFRTAPSLLKKPAKFLFAKVLAARKVEMTDKFFQHNEQVIADCESRADKTRNAELIVDEYTLYRFYNSRLPVEVYDIVSLRKWVKADSANRAMQFV